MAMIYDEEDYLEEEEFHAHDYELDNVDMPPSVEILWPVRDMDDLPF